MTIGLIAHDAKKKLMQNFCIAYRGILSKNTLYATGTTGRLIEEVANLNIHKYLAGHLGGMQAILPDRTPKRVDFPAPLRPMSPILSPSRISSFSISSTVWIPYSFLTFSAFNNIKKSLLNALRSEGI